jgi:hypothetical protein
LLEPINFTCGKVGSAWNFRASSCTNPHSHLWFGP